MYDSNATPAPSPTAPGRHQSPHPHRVPNPRRNILWVSVGLFPDTAAGCLGHVWVLCAPGTTRNQVTRIVHRPNTPLPLYAPRILLLNNPHDRSRRGMFCNDTFPFKKITRGDLNCSNVLKPPPMSSEYVPTHGHVHARFAGELSNPSDGRDILLQTRRSQNSAK